MRGRGLQHAHTLSHTRYNGINEWKSINELHYVVIHDVKTLTFDSISKMTYRCTKLVYVESRDLLLLVER